MTCTKCEELKARIADLELQLCNSHNEAYAKLQVHYKVTPNEAGVLMHLYYAKDRPLDKFFLHDNRVTARDLKAVNPDDVKVYISRIRNRMGHEAIITTGVGYLLSRRGRVLVDFALGLAA